MKGWSLLLLPLNVDWPMISSYKQNVAKGHSEISKPRPKRTRSIYLLPPGPQLPCCDKFKVEGITKMRAEALSLHQVIINSHVSEFYDSKSSNNTQ